MKTFLFFIALMVFVGCDKNDTGVTQTQTNEKTLSNLSSKENLNENKPSKNSTLTQNFPAKKNPVWIPGNYKGLQPGKSTEKDVRRIFGTPKEIIHPEDGEDNPIESKLDYVYEEEPQIIIDKKSGIVEEIWGGNDVFTFKEIIGKYGNDFYEIEFKKKGCIFKEFKDFKDKKSNDYPIYFAYPQNGFYFAVDQKNDLVAFQYVAKCAGEDD